LLSYSPFFVLNKSIILIIIYYIKKILYKINFFLKNKNFYKGVVL